ncbi:MAG: stage II sporulation protein M [Nanoarchaeota archaeon]
MIKIFKSNLMRNFFKWLKINFIFLFITFILFSFLSFFFPDSFLNLGRTWGNYSNNLIPKIFESSSSSLFFNILTKNIFVTILFFIASLLFLSPLISIIGGTFYSLGFMSTIDHFLKGEIAYPLIYSPILIIIEISFILLTISFASALASEIFNVNPNKKSIILYWKENWRRLFPQTKKSFKDILKEYKKEISLFIILIILLILFGAFFEIMINRF